MQIVDSDIDDNWSSSFVPRVPRPMPDGYGQMHNLFILVFILAGTE